ncbi:hypothetical protein HBB16_07850 [Pseudonocardia sp. MCCB 268]|nr:hypothetical protein [Pseudonocardia cytotoxica]
MTGASVPRPGVLIDPDAADERHVVTGEGGTVLRSGVRRGVRELPVVAAGDVEAPEVRCSSCTFSPRQRHERADRLERIRRDARCRHCRGLERADRVGALPR